MRSLSIAEVLEIHRAEGKTPLNLQPRGGEFDIAAFDVKTGKRVWREVTKNLVTHALSEYFLLGNLFTAAYVFIAPDTKPTHVLKTSYRSTYSSGHAAASSFDANVTSRLWTITGTILAPTAGKTRTFQTVGVSRGTYLAIGNSTTIANVLAATLLSQERVQDDTQQVVVSYRLAWEEGSNV